MEELVTARRGPAQATFAGRFQLQSARIRASALKSATRWPAREESD